MKVLKWVILVVVLMISVFPVPVSAGTATLVWDAPTTYTDGSLLPAGDIDHYTVCWGLTSGAKTNCTNVTTNTATITTAPSGTTIYAVVTVTTKASVGGLESANSNIASKLIPFSTPGACGNARFLP